MKTIRFPLFFLLYLSVLISSPLFAQESSDETVELGAINIVYENFKTEVLINDNKSSFFKTRFVLTDAL